MTSLLLKRIENNKQHGRQYGGVGEPLTLTLTHLLHLTLVRCEMYLTVYLTFTFNIVTLKVGHILIISVVCVNIIKIKSFVYDLYLK